VSRSTRRSTASAGSSVEFDSDMKRREDLEDVALHLSEKVS